MSGEAPQVKEKAQLQFGMDDPDFAAIHLQLCKTLDAAGGIPMVVSGLSQAPNRLVPTRSDAPKAAGLTMNASTSEGVQTFDMFVLPGLSQASPVGVMPYQGNRISGFLSLNPSWEGVICLPGPTTHWALISADEVVSFQSFLTASMVRAALYDAGVRAESWNTQALENSVADTISRPELTAARLAEAVAGKALNSEDALDAAGKIWGTLLGAELAAARPYWLGQNLAVIGPNDLATAYVTALKAQGLSATVADDERMCLAGLIEVWRQRGS